jgi:hypothetical protein
VGDLPEVDFLATELICFSSHDMAEHEEKRALDPWSDKFPMFSKFMEFGPDILPAVLVSYPDKAIAGFMKFSSAKIANCDVRIS